MYLLVCANMHRPKLTLQSAHPVNFKIVYVAFSELLIKTKMNTVKSQSHSRGRVTRPVHVCPPVTLRLTDTVRKNENRG